MIASLVRMVLRVGRAGLRAYAKDLMMTAAMAEIAADVCEIFASRMADPEPGEEPTTEATE